MQQLIELRSSGEQGRAFAPPERGVRYAALIERASNGVEGRGFGSTFTSRSLKRRSTPCPSAWHASGGCALGTWVEPNQRV
jgi:hypothetical protein